MAVFMFYMGVFSIGFGLMAGLADLLEKFIW
jgi:hypothetical protein